MSHRKLINVDGANTYNYILLPEGVTFEDILRLLDGAIAVERIFTPRPDGKSYKVMNGGKPVRPNILLLDENEISFGDPIVAGPESLPAMLPLPGDAPAAVDGDPVDDVKPEGVRGEDPLF